MEKNKLRIFWMGLMLPFLALACTCSLLSPSGPTATRPAPTLSAPAAAPVQKAAPALTTNEEAVLVDLYSRANLAVVNIITYSNQLQSPFPSGQGSGFVFDANGHIVTNAHVVHGASQIEVIFADSTTLRAEITGEDLHSDLAVIKVDELPSGTQPLPLGNMNEVAVGQTVVAIGNPFGLGGTLTKGIVSAMGRTIPALTQFSIPQSIQTDAPINPGNSGGPLLNLKGEVIGVNAQIETDGASRVNSGVGFAIPVSIVSRVVPDLIENSEHEWAWLGVAGRSVNLALVEAMDLTINKGAYISEVVDDGPAERAGLRGAIRETTINGQVIEVGGDIITAIDGQTVSSFEDLLIYIALYTSPGQDVTLTILRDDRTREIVLTLGSRPKETFEPFSLP